MTEYLISWTIELDANSPLEAARAAHRIMLDPQSRGTVFKVLAEGCDKEVDIDLDSEDPEITKIGTFQNGESGNIFEVEREVFSDGHVELHLQTCETVHGSWFVTPEFAKAVNIWLQEKFPGHAEVDFRESGAQGEGYVAMCVGGA